jgi:hypothetical protein
MTFVRVTVLSTDPAKQAEIERFANERFVPKIRQLPGFRRWTAAGDRAGHGLTISEWDTLEQAQSGGDALGLAQEIADLGTKAETVYVYEVVTQA